MDHLEWIKNGLAKPGKTRKGLAEAIGRQPSAITSLFKKGGRRLQLHEVPLAAAYFEESIPSFGSAVDIVGKVGTTPDGLIVFAQQKDRYGEAPMPPGGGEKDSVAIEVVGDSVHATARDGSLIYFDKGRDPPSSEMVEQLCVVGLADQRVVLKYLNPGSGPGLFNLESPTIPVMRDATVVWASLVTAIIPPAQARKIIERPAPKVAPRRKR